MAKELAHPRTLTPVSGTFNGVAPGSRVFGGIITAGDYTAPDAAILNAIVTVLAETNALTITAQWQVSMDGSTWIDVAHTPWNTAGVPLATGTTGADSPVTKAIGAPSAVEAFRLARLSLVVGGATGTSGDTFSITSNFRTVQ